jgi:arginyl-tRNA synthetase
VPGGLQYRGEYLVPVGAALRQIFRDTLAGPGARPRRRRLARHRARLHRDRHDGAIREDLAALGVQHDVFISEAQLVRRASWSRPRPC